MKESIKYIYVYTNIMTSHAGSYDCAPNWIWNPNPSLNLNLKWKYKEYKKWDKGRLPYVMGWISPRTGPFLTARPPSPLVLFFPFFLHNTVGWAQLSVILGQPTSAAQPTETSATGHVQWLTPGSHLTVFLLPRERIWTNHAELHMWPPPHNSPAK
jgi:hypothetical protein